MHPRSESPTEKGTVPIYTIGYGVRTIDVFVNVLHQYEIAYLIDVRSQPYSRYQKDFSRNNLEVVLGNHDIRYVFMGDLLGGRPNSPSCYTAGKIDYAKCQKADFFKRGMDRLQTAYRQQLRTVLMCSEEKPEHCHRSKLIGEALVSSQIDVVHIDENGLAQSHQEIVYRYTKGQGTLFESAL